MRDFIAALLTLLLLGGLFAYVTSMVAPKRIQFNKKLFKTEKRSTLSWIYGGAMLFIVALIGMVAPGANEIANTANTSETANSLTAKAQGTKGSDSTPNQAYYKVIKVVDGDTIDVDIDGEIERLRLIGIDTPETVDPRKPVQCFGKEASKRAKKLLDGKYISLEADASQGERDKYNRLLRYVFLKDGTNFNKQMITDGYAHEYTYNLPYKYQGKFKAAEKTAMNNNRGLWSPDTCNGSTSGEITSSKQSSSSSNPSSSSSSSNSSSNQNCDTNYTPCVKQVSYDLDCSDIGFTVRVIGTDIHRLDRDGDGYGCESN